MQEIRIAICDDSSDDLSNLINILHADASILLTTYTDPASFLKEWQPNKFDLVLLDVIMPGTSGLDIAREIRKSDDDTIICFISSSAEYAVDGYEVNAIRYLLKPPTPQKVKAVLDLARRKLKEKSKTTISIVSNREKIQLNTDDILYIEVQNRVCVFHTIHGIYTTYSKIDSFEAILPSPPFCRCHRSFIVNFEYVSDMQEDFILTDGSKVYIRKTNRNDITLAYHKHIMTGARSDIGQADEGDWHG